MRTSLSKTLANLDKSTAGLPETMREVRSLVADLRGATSEIRAVASSARSVTETAGPEVTAALKRVREITDNLASTSARIDRLVEDNRQDIRSFTREGLPELERFLREGRAAAREIRDLSRSLREDPSQLLYQQSPEGVEIPR